MKTADVKITDADAVVEKFFFKTANKMLKQKNIVRKEITKDTSLAEIIYINPNAAELLFDIGLHCIGCAMSGAETLEEGCMAHGMSKKEVNELVKRLNKK